MAQVSGWGAQCQRQQGGISRDHRHSHTSRAESQISPAASLCACSPTADLDAVREGFEELRSALPDVLVGTKGEEAMRAAMQSAKFGVHCAISKARFVRQGKQKQVPDWGQLRWWAVRP